MEEGITYWSCLVNEQDAILLWDQSFSTETEALNHVSRRQRYYQHDNYRIGSATYHAGWHWWTVEKVWAESHPHGSDLQQVWSNRPHGWEWDALPEAG